MGGVTEINERTYPRPLNPCHNAPTFLETAQPNDDWGAEKNWWRLILPRHPRATKWRSRHAG